MFERRILTPFPSLLMRAEMASTEDPVEPDPTPDPEPEPEPTGTRIPIELYGAHVLVVRKRQV